MTTSEFLAKCSGVKAVAGGWIARCPGHDDRIASASIKNGDDGRILVHCHAGCTVDAICAGLQIEPKDLFPSNGNGQREIVATYDYTDATGKLLFQAVRYSPKGFSQRAPDGGGGWKYSLAGIDRVLYKLPQLKGHPAVVVCEGEKDVDAAWKLGIPATCNPMGAGKWLETYNEQLRAIGVDRVAIIPDNDAPGAAHAAAVAKSLHVAKFPVRIVHLPGLPDHGDLSDFLATHTKDELVALLRDTANWNPDAEPAVVDREFSVVGDSRYALVIHSAGVTMEVDRLRRDREGLTGELQVMVNGLFPLAKHHHGVISIGDFNLASVQARSTRAKLLADRSGDKDFDWFGALEEFVTDVMATERKGQPAIVLADALPEMDESSEIWDVEGFPLLADLPMVLFGDSSSGKSYFAMWLSGVLASRGVNILYADWEFSQREHRKRFERLFQPMPKNLHYARCEAPLAREADRLSRLVRELQCRYVVCDSIGFAVDGPAETHDAARGYFRGLRQLGVGTLNIAHIPAHTDEGRDPKIFGSVFFRAGARSAWYVERAAENPPGEIRIGLHHRKTNIGEQLPPRGYRIIFEHARTRVESTSLESVDELSAQLPLIQRIKRALADGPMSIKHLAEDLGTTANVIRATLGKHKSTFHRIGDKISLAQELDF